MKLIVAYMSGIEKTDRQTDRERQRERQADRQKKKNNIDPVKIQEQCQSGV